MNKNKGFTIIELMVVIAIIAVITSIILGLLNSSKAKGNDSKVVSQLKSMVNQAQLYTGPNPAQPWTTITPVGVGGGNLFTNSDSASNSLYRLASSLPTGTAVLYASDGVNPLAGGKWAFAATTSTGSFCVDHAGVGVAKVGAGTNLQVLNANVKTALYSCN